MQQRAAGRGRCPSHGEDCGCFIPPTRDAREGLGLRSASLVDHGSASQESQCLLDWSAVSDVVLGDGSVVVEVRVFFSFCRLSWRMVVWVWVLVVIVFVWSCARSSSSHSPSLGTSWKKPAMCRPLLFIGGLRGAAEGTLLPASHNLHHDVDVQLTHLC